MGVSFPSSGDCDPASKLDIELCWLGIDENKEDLSSNMPLVVANEIECLLGGEIGFGDRVGETDADKLGGEPGGVSRGVLVWDANNRPCAMRGLKAAMH
nr:hypothetical protein Iba_scaffold36928CG0010 [Ipomoea batatas]GMD63459.1 hypothetical protein Iba_chr12bCG15060 [Ipomoea batatas]GMD70578.1 hypothetical protein Iba_chr12eCG7680 [Ipomoea batatas]